MTTPSKDHPAHGRDGKDEAADAGGEAPPGTPRPSTPPVKEGSPLFKIAPADPKNAFDFEDVADK